MIAHFDDFCLWVYVLVDDMCKELEAHLRRPGPEPECSDSELIAICLIGECLGWDVETELLSHMQAHRDKFPIIPEQSRFNRRRRNLMGVINQMRRMMLARTELYQDAHCVVDSLPIPAVHFHLAPQSRAQWSQWGADYGPVPSKKMMIFGFKLHMLVTMGGLIIDFVLAPASYRDLAIGHELLEEHSDRIVIGDKAYVSAPVAEELWQNNRIRLMTKPRSNQKKQIPASLHRLYDRVRQIIETVTSQLSAQFSIETNHAHTFRGLCARLYTKLTAHTLCIYINRLLGVPNYLQIKQLAFPN
jgi:hypothetical protein